MKKPREEARTLFARSAPVVELSRHLRLQLRAHWSRHLRDVRAKLRPPARGLRAQSRVERMRWFWWISGHSINVVVAGLAEAGAYGIPLSTNDSRCDRNGLRVLHGD